MTLRKKLMTFKMYLQSFTFYYTNLKNSKSSQVKTIIKMVLLKQYNKNIINVMSVYVIHLVGQRTEGVHEVFMFSRSRDLY